MTSLLIDAFCCGLVVLAELVIIFISLLLIQLIFYRVFNINLYKIINKKLDRILQ